MSRIILAPYLHTPARPGRCLSGFIKVECQPEAIPNPVVRRGFRGGREQEKVNDGLCSCPLLERTHALGGTFFESWAAVNPLQVPLRARTSEAQAGDGSGALEGPWVDPEHP